MSKSHDINVARNGRNRHVGALLVAAVALLTFTSTAGIVTITLDHVEKRPDEPAIDARSLADEGRSNERRSSHLGGADDTTGRADQ